MVPVRSLTTPTHVDEVVTRRVIECVETFYKENTQIKASHGLSHVMAVYDHACQALACHQPALPARTCMEILVATLLHDVDDRKYFPSHSDDENSHTILAKANVPPDSTDVILYMISLVSCSKNGNTVPHEIMENKNFHLLIPRWSDRLEAVGKIGVVRCYQYNQELQQPLSSARSPRAQSLEELWELAKPERFEAYQATGASDDMISHYFDKLLHVACPPRELVQNAYLEERAQESSKELIEVCLRFGRTGVVDEDYILRLEADLHNG